MAWPPTTHQDVSDEITAMRAAWATYTPTFTATTNPTLANFSIAGRYRQIGKTIMFSIVITANSSTGLGSGPYEFGLPVAARDINEVTVAARQTAPTRTYIGSGETPTTVRLNLTSDFSAMNVTSSGITSTTVIRIGGVYEAA